MRSKYQNSLRKRIEDKVAVLRNWTESGVPKGQRDNVPNSLRAFGRWVDSSLGLEKITRPAALSTKGPNGTLLREAGSLMGHLIKTFRIHPTKSDELARLKVDNAKLELYLQKVTNGWHKQRSDNLSLKSELSKAELQLSNADQEIGDLKKQLRVLVPFK
jgi:hypothetical protein